MATPEASAGVSLGLNLCDDANRIHRGSIVSVVAGAGAKDGPGLDYPDAQAVIVDMGIRPLGQPFRLVQGDRLIIEHGPIHADGADWFLFSSAHPHARGEVGLGTTTTASAAWVPATVAGAPALELDRPAAQCVYEATGGSGTTVLEVPPIGCGPNATCSSASLDWAAGSSSGGACRLSVVRDDLNETVIDAAVQGWGVGAGGWSPASPVRLVIESDCNWTLGLTQG